MRILFQHANLARMVLAVSFATIAATAGVALSVERAEARSGWSCCVNYDDGWCDDTRCSENGQCTEESGDGCDYNACCMQV